MFIHWQSFLRDKVTEIFITQSLGVDNERAVYLPPFFYFELRLRWSRTLKRKIFAEIQISKYFASITTRFMPNLDIDLLRIIWVNLFECLHNYTQHWADNLVLVDSSDKRIHDFCIMTFTSISGFRYVWKPITSLSFKNARLSSKWGSNDINNILFFVVLFVTPHTG